MGLFSRRNHLDVEGRGMGRGLAKVFAQKGANVVIVARDQTKLDSALDYIMSNARSPHAQRFHALSADLTRSEENDRMIKLVTTWNDGEPPDIVWANAGTSYPHLFVDSSFEILRSQMDINYWAAAYLAHTTLRAWLALTFSSEKAADPSSPKPRHFIMTSSVLAFAGIAGYAPYSPAKAAMRSLADTLHSEVNLYNGAGADIKIHCVCPGTIESPGHEEEQKTKHEITKILEKGDTAQSEDEAAVAAVKALENGDYLVTTSLFGKAIRAGAWGNSPRNGWVAETIFIWIVAIVWLFLVPSMEKTVFEYGRKHGIASSSN